MVYKTNKLCGEIIWAPLSMYINCAYAYIQCIFMAHEAFPRYTLSFAQVNVSYKKFL